VLQIDLLGCGDSSGDFGDATWTHWVDDVVLGAAWLREHHPGLPLWLWGHRAGCLLAVEAARRLPIEANFLFWQPASAGQPLLQQFLRLKMAGQMRDGAVKGVTDSLKSALAAGKSVEVAGYELSAGLAEGLQDASLQEPPVSAGGARLVWLEVSAREPAELMPAAAAVVGRWQAAGYDVVAQAVPGPAFWQTVEIEEAPALLQVSVRHLTERHVPALAVPE
jgi:exosortase A-associated hydrolase 2